MIDLRKHAKDASRAIQLVVGRAVLTAVNDGAKRQQVQFEALKNEVKDAVERLQNYGMTSVPHEGAQVLFVSLGGNRDHPVAVVVDDPRYRPSGMQKGEVAIYTDEGDIIKLKRGRTIEIETTNLVVKAAEAARFETPILKVTGEIIDHCDDDGKSMSEMRNIFDHHTHNETQTVTHTPNQLMGSGA